MVSAEIDRARRVGLDAARILAARQLRQAQPELAVAVRQLAPVERAQLADPQDAVGGEPALHRAADPPQPVDRLVGEKPGRLLPADHRETARLVEIGGELGEKLVVAEADRDRDPERRLDPPRQRGESLRRRERRAALRAAVPLRSRNASSIESGSTSGVRRRISARTARPTSRYFAMSGRITTASGQAASALNIGIAERTP